MTDPPQPNPYVGPRSFATGERLYGRARESRDLTALLVAERIVLLHSPSGAGKTSLIQAALIPRLRRRAFAVRPVIRVNRAVAAPGANRYALSLLSCLEEDLELPADGALSAEALAGLSVAEYLARRPRPAPAGQGAAPRARVADEVLIFDQFEEVLTVDPTDEPAKHAFFAQLGDALRLHPHVWALFSIREDYVAALDPFLRPIPTRLSNTFRLDLLGRAAAAEAMVGPAAQAGVEFTAAAADRLAVDLAQVLVQRADGRAEQRTGPSVEPVQLQVVCRRLWERRFGLASGSGDGLAAPAAAPPPAPLERPQITVEDVQALGDVDRALADYYDEGVARAAAAGTDERIVRTWFERQLITGQGIRGQVLRGAAESRQVAEATIRSLRDSYLIRADERRGSTWYELAHDRLIAPVRDSNRAWFAANLSLLQRQAAIWADQSRSPSLLLRGAELAEAEAWLRGYAGELSQTEREFLAASRDERQRAERLRRLTISAFVAAGLALAFGLVALGFWRQAEANAREATAQRVTAEANAGRAEAAQATAEANYQLAEQRARVNKARELSFAAENQISVDPERAVLLGVAALGATEPGDPRVLEAADSLQQAAQAARLRRAIAAPGERLRAVAFSPDGSRVAAVDEGGQLYIWQAGAAGPPTTIAAHAGAAFAVAFSPDGRVLASGGADGAVRLWDGATGAPIAATTDLGPPARLRFSPDGTLLAVTTDLAGGVVADARTLALLLSVDSPDLVFDMAISPDNRTLAVADITGAKILRRADGSLERQLPHQTYVGAVAFSPDGATLASAEFGGTLFLWELAEPPREGGQEQPRARLGGHAGAVNGLAFSPDGAMLASAGGDAQIRLWNTDTFELVLALSGHRGTITGLALGAAGRSVATVSDDNTLRLWSLDLLHLRSTQAVAYAGGGDLLVSAGNDRVAYIWDAKSGALRQTLPDGVEQVSRLAVSRDGGLVVTNGSRVRVWAVGEERPRLELPPEIAARAVAISPDGRTVATGGSDMIVRLWDLATGQPRALDPLDNSIETIAFSPDGRLLAAGDVKGTVWLWELPGLAARPPLAFGAPVNRVVFSPDSRSLAVAGDRPEALIYDLARPDASLTLGGHTGSVTDIGFSPDGVRLATVATDRSLRLWSADGAPELQDYTLAANGSGLAWAPDGARVAVAGADGVVRVVPLDDASLVAFALSRVSRDRLADDECKQYLHTSCAP